MISLLRVRASNFLMSETDFFLLAQALGVYFWIILRLESNDWSASSGDSLLAWMLSLLAL